MNKPNVKGLVGALRTAVMQHGPEILTGIGIAGMVTTTVLAVKATPKALILIENEKRAQNQELLREADEQGFENYAQIEKLKPIEVIKVTWKCYVPAFVTGVFSISCLVGASSVSLKRNAVLATAYKLSETALTEYRDAVVETIGEKKEQTVRDKVAENRIKNDPVTTKEVIITSGGDTLCYDAISGRYFKSDIDKIKKAENELNRLMLRDGYVSLNDFYDELDLEHTKIGDELGWSVDDGLLDLDFSSQLAEDGTPCLVVDYGTAPKYGYSHFS